MSKNQSLIQFTPRQVVMALETQAKKEKKEKKNDKKGSSEILEDSKDMVMNGGDVSARGNGRDVLIRSIAGFLESNGFKKTLAVFQSEAQIEENSWRSPIVNLNDVVAKILDSSDVLAVHAIENGKSQDTVNKPEMKTGKEKKKKKSSEELKQAEDKREEANADKNNEKNESDPSQNGNVKTEESDKKKEKEEKKKNKKKKEVEEVKGTGEEHATVEEMEPKEKKKDKNKRKGSDSSENEEAENGENVAKKEDKDGKRKKKKQSEVGKETQDKEKVTDQETNVENEEKTVTKKRKKGDAGNVENNSKKRKFEEANEGANTASEENINGVKSGKKEKQSAELKSANAFKRVKVEEVKFVDERLTDNSYWAKDGADSGYGAKAQQVLEQVRGRDFRHEKTKKKRGTYKGGQIDLQSHSIKFNYSDEE